MTEIIIRDEDGRQRALDTIGLLNIEKPWQIEWKPYVKRRSLSQNALMWKLVGAVVDHVKDHTGHDADEIHEFFKQKFLMPKGISMGGEVYEYRSTKKLTTAEMSSYMDAIYRWATSDLGLVLPVPEEMHERAAA